LYLKAERLFVSINQRYDTTEREGSFVWCRAKHDSDYQSTNMEQDSHCGEIDLMHIIFQYEGISSNMEGNLIIFTLNTFELGHLDMKNTNELKFYIYFCDELRNFKL